MNDRKPSDRVAAKWGRRRLLWADQYANADTPSKLAAFEFNRVRTVIGDLPARDQAAAWKRLTEWLQAEVDRITDVTGGDVHIQSSRSAPGEGSGQPRALASARARLPRIFNTDSHSGK